MRIFKPFPIYINHAGYWAEKLARELIDDPMMTESLSYHRKKWYEIQVDPQQSTESLDYEERVYRLLQHIFSTRVGKLLLYSLNRLKKYWIVPKTAWDRWRCNNCAAYTFPMRPEEGGGIRVYFNPKGIQFKGVAERRRHPVPRARSCLSIWNSWLLRT